MEKVYAKRPKRTETRIIVFYDDDTKFLIKTNVPQEIIKQAIQHRNYCIENNIEMSSDFEEIQKFIWTQYVNFIFEEIGYVDDIEGYYW